MATITQTNVTLDLANLPSGPVAALAKEGDGFAVYAAQDMALVHGCITRAWNSIYQQAPLIVKKDYPDFIEYAISWHRVLEIHHDGEEEGLYPAMEACMGRPGFFSAAVEEHASFHDGLDRYKAYLEDCRKNPDTFSGDKLVSIMASFGETLFNHLAAEPALLLTVRGFDDAALRKLWDEHTKEVMGGASMVSDLPLVWANFDTTYENGQWANFPEIPAPVKFFMKHVASIWHSSWWRFGSTTLGGQPQTLLALREGYGK